MKTGEVGQVRSCEVALRPRRKGEDQEERYQHKELATPTVGVQRIAVILPMEEQEGEEGGRNPEDPEESGRRVAVGSDEPGPQRTSPGKSQS